MSRGLFLAVVVYALSASGLAADEPAPVSLDVAVQTGLVEVEVMGRGACSGDAVRVEVRRKVTREVRVVVVPGTVMESPSDKVQSMVCHGVKYQKAGDKYRRVDVMVLNDDVPQTFLLEAFCRDFSKPTPRADSPFRLGTTSCQTTAVIVKGKANGVDTKAIQIAVWTQRGVSEQEIRRRFRATDAEFKAANSLVNAVKASERGDVAAERRIIESFGIDVGGLIDGIRESRAALPFRKGDKVVVTSDSAPIRARQRTVGTVKKGETFEVLAVLKVGVNVEFVPGEGKPSERGWIALEHVQLADGAPRGEGRPIIRELGKLVSESELEIITMSEHGS
jgi:hypothetical protein